MTEKVVNIDADKSHIIKLYAFDYLRVIALFMILYDHLGGFRNPDWIVKKTIDFFFTMPLNIIQDFGAFGVSLFFLISGFLFTYNGNYKHEVKKAVKKIIKTYVGCLISFFWFYVLQNLVWMREATYWSQFSIRQWIESATLVGYFITGSGDVINGTTWFLIPLFFFYLVRIGYAYIYEKIKPEWNILLLEFFVLMIMILSKEFHLAVSSEIVFVYMPLMGMILGEMFRNARTLSIYKGILLLLVNYMSMVVWFWVFVREYHDTNCYLISFMYSVFLIILFAVFKECFKENRLIGFLCKVSLSVYLMHMTFGSYLLTLFADISLPFSISFVITTGIIFLISYVHMNIMKRITK